MTQPPVLILSEAQFNELLEKAAERGADKAVEKFTNAALRSIGKTVITRLFKMVAILVIGGYFYAKSKGWIME